MTTMAWVLRPVAGGEVGSVAGVLTEEPLEIGPAAEDEVLVEPLFVCWEGNMTHAVTRDPIDICRQRNEERVVIGNAGVVRVLEVGARAAEEFREGDLCLVFCNGIADANGYPDKIYAYDAPGTIGLLAKRTRLQAAQLIPIPDAGEISLAQWAAFSLRYITAWSNWQAAFGCWRVLVAGRNGHAPRVWGWGGGVTYAELTLAARMGASTAMIASSDDRLRLIEQSGIVPIRRSDFAGLSFDATAYAADTEYRARYNAAERQFLEIVAAKTNGRGVDIFVDFIGLPVYRATLKSLARPGVITTAGWKEGMNLSTLRAIECMRWHTHVHTHYARRAEAEAAVAYAVETGWVPPPPERIYRWDEIPALAEAHARDAVASYFPIAAVNLP